MTSLTRREFHRFTIGGMFAGLAPHKGVVLGVQSYSFRDRPLDAAIDGMSKAGLTSCELWQGHLEPRDIPREEMRRWRETVSLDVFRKTSEKFRSAGIEISAYNISFKEDFSDAEIERGFDMAQALGTKVITASANVSAVPRVARVAARRKVPVGMHNHSDPDPNEFASPDSLTRAADAPGGFVRINLDIGHFTAANHDAVDFLRRHHARIVSLHLKDRKRNQGENVPFGQGDTPIGQVLRMLRDERWTIPANIEYEYKGEDTIDEVKRCLEYCRRELDT
jgi:sugar phosphate isomerase/epimerase